MTRPRRALLGSFALLAACCKEPTPQAAARYQDCLREGHGRHACEPLLGPAGDRPERPTARASTPPHVSAR